MEIIFLVIAALAVVLCIWFLIYDRPRKGRGFADITAEWDPPVIVDSILTPEECQQIIEKATPFFARSAVVGASFRSESVV